MIATSHGPESSLFDIGAQQIIGSLLGRRDRTGRVRFGRKYCLDLILHCLAHRNRVERIEPGNGVFQLIQRDLCVRMVGNEFLHIGQVVGSLAMAIDDV